MLQRIRDRITGVMAGVVLMLLIIPFAFWGLGDYLGATGQNYAAEVEGVEITPNQLNNAYRSNMQRLEQAWGDAFDPSMFDDAEMRRQTLDGLIRQALIDTKVESQGYRISDSRLIETIHDIDAFKAGDSFDPDTYRLTLSMQGYSVSQFERRMRDDLTGGQFRRAISDSAFVTDREVRDHLSLDGQERQVAWLQIGARAFRDQVEVTDEAVQAYYEENGDGFMTEEAVDLAYVELRAEDLSGGIEVSEDALRDFYREQAEVDRSPERRRARHILISTDEGTGPEEAAERIEEIKARLDEGESFASLAEEYSDDSGSAPEGGDLGWLEREMLVGGFADALFSMAEGEVRGPVESEFGVHLIELMEIQTSTARPFELVRDQVEQQYLEQRALDRYYELAEEMAEVAWENPGDLEPVASVAGISIRNAQDVTRGSTEGVARYAEVRETAFSEEAISAGEVSRPVELEEGHVLFLRVVGHHPPEVRPLAEVEEEVRQRLIAERSVELAREHAEAVLERVRAGEPLAAAGEGPGVSFEPPAYLRRGDSRLPRGVSGAVFEAPRPAGDASAYYDLVEAGTGRFFVFELTDVRYGDPDAVEASTLESTRLNLATRRGDATVSAYIAGLRENAEVRINEDFVER